MRRITTTLLFFIIFHNCSHAQLKMIPQNAPQYYINDATYNHKEKIVAFSEYRMNRLVFIDAVSKLRIGELPTESPVIALVTDSAGQYIIAATDRGNIHFIDAKTLTLQKTINGNDYFNDDKYAILKNYFPLLVTKEHLYFTGYVDKTNTTYKGNFTTANRPEPSSVYIYKYNLLANELTIVGRYEKGSSLAFTQNKKEKKLLLLTEKKLYTISEEKNKITDSIDITHLNISDYGAKYYLLDEVLNSRLILLNSSNNTCKFYDANTMLERQSIDNVYRITQGSNNKLLYQGMNRYFYSYKIKENTYAPFSTDSISYRPWCYKMWAVATDKIDFITVAGIGNLDYETTTTSFPEKNTFEAPWGLAVSNSSHFVFANGKNIFEYDYVRMQVARQIATVDGNVIQTKYLGGNEEKLIVETLNESENRNNSVSQTIAIDYKTGKQLWAYKNGSKRLEDLRISKDRSKVLLLTDYRTVQQIDVATGKKEMEIPFQQNIYGVDYIGDTDSLFISLAKENKGYSILGFGKNLSPTSLGSFESHYPFRVFEMDGSKGYSALAYPEDSRFYISSFYPGEQTKIIEHNARVIAYSNNNQWLAAGSFLGGYVRVFSFPDMRKIIDLKCGVGKVFDIIFSADDRLLFAVLEDGHVSIINLEKKAHVADVLLNNNNHLVKNAEGYYSASKNIVNEIGLRAGNRCFPISNADIKYNQPQQIAENIGVADTNLIAAFTNAYKKRLVKLKADPGKINDINSFPSAIIINTANIATNTAATTQNLQLKFTSAKGNELISYNILVNGVPLFGSKGKAIAKKTLWETTIKVPLAAGSNIIEAECMSLSGVRSLREKVKVNCSAKAVTNVYFIGIGIDKFREQKYNLSWCVKDISDIAFALSKLYGNRCRIDTLFNEKVNRKSVALLKKRLMQTTVNDKVVIAYSGHGVLNKQYDYFLSTSNISFEKPEEYGLPYEELENLLDSIPARKKLLLLDACHSGEVDKEDIRIIDATAKTNGIIKGFDPDDENGNKILGLQNSFELMQNLFVNVGKGTGATIISAAAGTQFALERNDLKNGVFTYCLLEALNKRKSIKISELKKIVGERVTELTQGAQKPTSRSEVIAVDWEL